MSGRRIPLIPTVLVLAAVAVMISLGMWQLRRAEWKEDLALRAAHNLIMAGRDLPDRLEPGLDYRRFRAVCDKLLFDLSPSSGTGRGGMTGWLQKASCVRGEGRDSIIVGLGITERPDRLDGAGAPAVFWGRVLNLSIEGGADYILYAERPLTGLIPVAQPTPEMAMTTTPDGHRGYAMQWFLFAGVAVIIYLLALRRRFVDSRSKRPGA